MEGALVWLILARAEGVGRKRLAALMAACPDPADAWRLTVSDLLQVPGWYAKESMATVTIRRSRQAATEAGNELARAERAKLRLVLLTDPDYPVYLRQSPSPPPYFYQAGPWTPDGRVVVAVIGSRKPTAYGLTVAERFGRELAQANAVVVSGMARGIDAAAHRGALSVGGCTVAVLGCGADVVYPREAALLYRQIRSTGAIISELPPGTEPRKQHFPERNRIISGLAHAVVVVESSSQSGTLSTVDAALEQGREVFAVPGPITSPLSVGPHQLIRTGATLVISAEQVLEHLNGGPSAPFRDRAVPEHLAPEVERVLLWMGEHPRWAGDLAEGCGLSAGQLQSFLTMMELRGRIRRLPDGQYVRVG